MTNRSVGLIRELSSADNKAVVNLVCFPCAGGSSITYREWPEVPDNCGKYSIELLGRGRSSNEAPFRNMSEVIDRVSCEIQKLPNLPTVFFGHSLGGWVAYELCRKMFELGLALPEHLVISGSLPIMLNRLPPYVHKMSIDDLQEELRVLGGTPSSVLEDKEMLTWFSRAIQADFEIFEKHKHVHRTALNLNVDIWAATDDPRIPIDLIPLWKQLFCGSIKETYFEGGHMFYDKVNNSQRSNALLMSVIERVKQLDNTNGDRYAHNRIAS